VKYKPEKTPRWIVREKEWCRRTVWRCILKVNKVIDGSIIWMKSTRSSSGASAFSHKYTSLFPSRDKGPKWDVVSTLGCVWICIMCIYFLLPPHTPSHPIRFGLFHMDDTRICQVLEPQNSDRGNCLWMCLCSSSEALHAVCRLLTLFCYWSCFTNIFNHP